MVDFSRNLTYADAGPKTNGIELLSCVTCIIGERDVADTSQTSPNYLAAVDAMDADMLALCFADNALVHDEDRDYRGLGSIRSWMQKTQTKYKYVMKPLDALVGEETVKLRARLTGDFPGSPIDLDYTFTLANDKITTLEIG